MICPVVLSKGISSGTGALATTLVNGPVPLFLGAYMPRKSKRDAQGKRTPWFSKKAEEAHQEAAATVRRIGIVTLDTGRTIVDCDALVGLYFAEEGYSLRIIHDKDGAAWYKCGITNRDGEKYYLLVSKHKSETHSTALLNLCEKIEEMWRGYLKPSPDTWKG